MMLFIFLFLATLTIYANGILPLFLLLRIHDAVNCRYGDWSRWKKSMKLSLWSWIGVVCFIIVYVEIFREKIKEKKNDSGTNQIG